MIAVIADDLTGAAELAGISLRYGLKVELCVDRVEYNQADVLIVSTDSRSLNKNEAIAITEKIVKQVLQLKPGWVYKKIDSVLRGFVIEETKVQMHLMNRSAAIIMPANPSLGRTIRNGEYFVNGARLNQAGFEHDPEFPVKTSFVKKILKDEVALARPGEKIGNGITIGEVTKFEDYRTWVDKIGKETVLVGAGDFYTALLDQNYRKTRQEKFQMQMPHLYVCGTAFKERKKQIKELDCVTYLPELLDEKWLEKILTVIEQQRKLIIAINETPASAAELRKTMANAVNEIVRRSSIREIFIEGGSTAATVLEELYIKSLEPLNELQRGVVRMKARDFFITVKPGSYELPVEIKELYSIK